MKSENSFKKLTAVIAGILLAGSTMPFTAEAEDTTVSTESTSTGRYL